MQTGKRQLNYRKVLNGIQFYHVLLTIAGMIGKVKVMDLCIPHTTAKIKRNLPWLNKGVLNAIKKRDALFRTAKATGKLCDREKYNQKRNQVVSMLRESKQSFFDNNLNQTDVKTFWKTVRILNRDYSSSIPTLTDCNKTADTNLDKATTTSIRASTTTTGST